MLKICGYCNAKFKELLPPINKKEEVLGLCPNCKNEITKWIPLNENELMIIEDIEYGFAW